MLMSPLLNRRSLFALVAGAGVLIANIGRASPNRAVTVHKDPNCSCCTGWAKHLVKAGFEVRTVNTKGLNAIKERLGVPRDLFACHTAEVHGYVVEGHVPAAALKRFLDEKPEAIGLAVPGMPIGSPGMEGGAPETYAVIQLGAQGRKEYMRFRGDRAL
jgi:hypothetical protein